MDEFHDAIGQRARGISAGIIIQRETPSVEIACLDMPLPQDGDAADAGMRLDLLILGDDGFLLPLHAVQQAIVVAKEQASEAQPLKAAGGLIEQVDLLCRRYFASVVMGCDEAELVEHDRRLSCRRHYCLDHPGLCGHSNTAMIDKVHLLAARLTRP